MSKFMEGSNTNTKSLSSQNSDESTGTPNRSLNDQIRHVIGKEEQKRLRRNGRLPLKIVKTMKNSKNSLSNTLSENGSLFLPMSLYNINNNSNPYSKRFKGNRKAYIGQQQIRSNPFTTTRKRNPNSRARSKSKSKTYKNKNKNRNEDKENFISSRKSGSKTSSRSITPSKKPQSRKVSKNRSTMTRRRIFGNRTNI